MQIKNKIENQLVQVSTRSDEKYTYTHTHTHTDKTGLKMSSARNRQVGHNLKGVQTAVKTEQPQV